MPSTKPRVTIYLNEPDKDYLNQWAKDDRRTVNNIVAILIEQALSDRRAGRDSREALALAIEFLQNLIAEKKPGLTLIAKLAQETDLTEEDLISLRDRTFKKGDR